jgi:hypothetical protein
MNAAVQIVFIPVPVAGSSFPRVIGTHPKSEHKTSPHWPLNQQIPSDATRRMLDDARRQLADERGRRLLRELEHRP